MLTDTKLRALKPKTSVYRVADTNGLCIEVRTTGARLWRYRYRYAGKASMAALGEYPMMGLAEARAERDRLRVLVKGGGNPAHVARVERAAKLEHAETTFAAVAAELLAKRAKEGLSPGSVTRERRLIEKDLARIGGLPVADVTAPALLAALRKIEQRGVIETAHRARGLAGQVFRYAIATGRAQGNPAADLAGALESPRVRHFASVTEPERVGELLRTIRSYTGSPVTVAALNLAPLVFVRPGELRAARWADIDLDAAEWRYIATKTDTPHIVPLSSQAVAILRELHPLTGRGEFVFPGVRSARRPMSENTINAALRYMGIDSDTMTGHGFRAMARTILDEVLHYRPDYIEHQLAHAVRDPNGRAYNRTAHLPERRKMMQGWANYLDQLREGGNVLLLRKASGASRQQRPAGGVITTPAGLTTTVPLENDHGSQQIIRPRPTTVDTGFREIPAEGMRLLAVSAGLDSRTATREASDLEDAVRRVLAGSIEAGTDGSTAYLCEFALETAKALREAAGCDD